MAQRHAVASMILLAVLLVACRAPRWQLSEVADWPPHQFKWQDYSRQEIIQALTLEPGTCDMLEVGGSMHRVRVQLF